MSVLLVARTVSTRCICAQTASHLPVRPLAGRKTQVHHCAARPGRLSNTRRLLNNKIDDLTKSLLLTNAILFRYLYILSVREVLSRVGSWEALVCLSIQIRVSAFFRPFP